MSGDVVGTASMNSGESVVGVSAEAASAASMNSSNSEIGASADATSTASMNSSNSVVATVRRAEELRGGVARGAHARAQLAAEEAGGVGVRQSGGARSTFRGVGVGTPVRSVLVVVTAVALAAGTSGCRHRTAERDRPALPTAGSTSPAASSTTPSASSSGGAISQQDLDQLNGILGSVGGAASSVRSAVAGDTASPQG